MTAPRLVILTPDPDDETRYDDWHEQAAHIEALLPGVAISYSAWSAPLADAALTLPVMAWGYHRHITRWYAALDAWEASGAHLANPVPILRWNTDKAYLTDLQRRGVAVVSTIDVPQLDDDALSDARKALSAIDVVIKPPISAGSDATFRLTAGQRVPPEVVGQRMLVQPTMPAIIDVGELSLFYLAGELAHAIIKRTKRGEFRVQPQFGGRVEAIEPPHTALQSAEAALTAIEGDLLYARVDLIADGANYRVMEVELIEPWLYLRDAADGGAAFGAAVRGLLERTLPSHTQPR